jgi:hypothetical protein
LLPLAASSSAAWALRLKASADARIRLVYFMLYLLDRPVGSGHDATRGLREEVKDQMRCK